jgi:3'-phosphoadenosine 5'-phosphosulfate sulfotransferase (PAPS reductase)/FAD synthetase
MGYIVTQEEFERRVSMSLRDKIDMSCEKIESWYDHYDGQVYVAFSGGKDSTVLLDIVRNRAIIPDSKDIPAVFSDTGLEYPEIREFVKTVENVIWVKPNMNFREVIERYGYPIISKAQSQYLFEYRNSNSEKLKNLRLNGSDKGNFKISEKWKFLIDAPFKIHYKCCDVLKKNPMKKYEKQTNRKPIIGTMAEESFRRKTNYMKYGCNAFDKKNPNSMPLSFWTEKDVWDYIKLYDLSYSKIYDMGYTRTGCMFCMYGVDSEKCPNRFQMMEETHPKMYKYCIDNLKIGEVLNYMGIDYENDDSKNS